MTATQTDPLHVLREYRNLAPWNLRDLAGLVGAVLDASAITPINAAARAQPSERTIRFYVTKVLVSPPDRLPLRGRGAPPRGKSGRALTAWLTRDAERDPQAASNWRRIPVSRGVELHVDAAHPLVRVGPDEATVAEAVRQLLAKLLPQGSA